jgi:hypothetical protein
VLKTSNDRCEFDRVYKNFDPRAAIIREVAEEVFEIQGRDPMIDVAIALEKAARADKYFVERKLYPNVDFYSGSTDASPPHKTSCRYQAHGKRRSVLGFVFSFRLMILNLIYIMV